MNNLNLVENQNILTEFVNSNVFADVTDVVVYILSTSLNDVNAPFNYEDIENCYIDDLYVEVMEWWQVSPMLCKKLEEKGEAVISHMNYWGRCTTGQRIMLDEVIEEIAEDLELLK